MSERDECANISLFRHCNRIASKCIFTDTTCNFTIISSTGKLSQSSENGPHESCHGANTTLIVIFEQDFYFWYAVLENPVNPTPFGGGGVAKYCNLEWLLNLVEKKPKNILNPLYFPGKY